MGICCTFVEQKNRNIAPNVMADDTVATFWRVHMCESTWLKHSIRHQNTVACQGSDAEVSTDLTSGDVVGKLS